MVSRQHVIKSLIGCIPTNARKQTEREPLIGFACGHVYHLSCLLKANPDTSNPATLQRLQNQLGYAAGDADEAGGYTGRSVGAKVAHAHIVRGVLRGGCRVCHGAVS